LGSFPGVEVKDKKRIETAKSYPGKLKLNVLSTVFGVETKINLSETLRLREVVYKTLFVRSYEFIP